MLIFYIEQTVWRCFSDVVVSRSAANGIELMHVESEVKVTNVTVSDNDLNGLSVVSELVDLADIEAARE